jgi:hypothetical protein
METTVKSNKSLTSYLLIVASSSLAAFAALSFIFHISPHDILEKMADFSKHHYFSTGIFCLLSAVVLFKFYLRSLDVRDAKKKVVTATRSRRSARRQTLAILRNLKRSVSSAANTETTGYVNKLEISKMHFENQEDVLSVAEQENRAQLLARALSLGNLYQQKIVICFMHNGLRKYTIGTVLLADDQFITLKGGACLPVKCIYKVEL